jgi:Activator of Hsp90 ATPase homolog 1-like protein
MTRLSRHTRAPRSLVYHALLDAEAVQQWMVPDAMTSHVHSFDARDGGMFRITINGRRYYDGGGCSATNAQLAKGYDKVLVLHMMIALPDPSGDGKAVYAPDAYPAEHRLLVEAGSRVETIDPADAGVDAIAINLNPASMTATVDAGIALGKALAANIATFWN